MMNATALGRAFVYVGLVLLITLLPLALTMIAGGSIQVHLDGAYAFLFDDSVTFLPLSLIAAVLMDYYYSRTVVFTRALEGLYIVFFPFVLITLMYVLFFTIHSLLTPMDNRIVDLAIVQGWLALSSVVYATGMKYLMFATEGEKS